MRFVTYRYKRSPCIRLSYREKKYRHRNVFHVTEFKIKISFVRCNHKLRLDQIIMKRWTLERIGQKRTGLCHMTIWISEAWIPGYRVAAVTWLLPIHLPCSVRPRSCRLDRNCTSLPYLTHERRCK